MLREGGSKFSGLDSVCWILHKDVQESNFAVTAAGGQLPGGSCQTTFKLLINLYNGKTCKWQHISNLIDQSCVCVRL